MTPIISEIDSQRFGIVCAKATIECVDSDVDTLFSACRDQGVRLLMVRTSTSDHKHIHDLERGGAFLADTLIYTRTKLAPPYPEPSVPVRTAVPTDADAVAMVAARAFAGYRGHYHNDPFLARTDVDEVYVSWATNCCIDPNVADVVLLAERIDGIAGFGAIRKLNETTADCLLYGVDPEHRGNGLLTELVKASMRWAHENGYQFIEYSTHLENIPAQRVVARLGFLPYKSLHTFHKWFK